MLQITSHKISHSSPLTNGVCSRLFRAHVKVHHHYLYNWHQSIINVGRSIIHIFPICSNHVTLLQTTEIQKVRWPVYLVIEFLRVGQLEFVFHVWIVVNACNKSSYTSLERDKNAYIYNHHIYNANERKLPYRSRQHFLFTKHNQLNA